VQHGVQGEPVKIDWKAVAEGDEVDLRIRCWPRGDAVDMSSGVQSAGARKQSTCRKQGSDASERAKYARVDQALDNLMSMPFAVKAMRGPSVSS
jgi:hypothetical protein